MKCYSYHMLFSFKFSFNIQTTNYFDTKQLVLDNLPAYLKKIQFNSELDLSVKAIEPFHEKKSFQMVSPTIPVKVKLLWFVVDKF